jgi:hypothetical protein
MAYRVDKKEYNSQLPVRLLPTSHVHRRHPRRSAAANMDPIYVLYVVSARLASASSQLPGFSLRTKREWTRAASFRLSCPSSDSVRKRHGPVLLADTVSAELLPHVYASEQARMDAQR